MASKRFIARRSQVKEIRSDNGTNFTGGERELRESINTWNHNKIHEALLQKNVKWMFNHIFTRYVTGTEAHTFKTRLSVTQLQIKRKNSHDNYKLAIFKCMHKAYNGRLPGRLLHKLLCNFLATFGLSSNF